MAASDEDLETLKRMIKAKQDADFEEIKRGLVLLARGIHENGGVINRKMQDGMQILTDWLVSQSNTPNSVFIVPREA